jgi:hypothetical protein
LSIPEEGLLKKFKRLSFAASFRWVFRFSPDEDGAEHELVGEGTLGEFSSGGGHWVLLLLGWVFGNAFGVMKRWPKWSTSDLENDLLMKSYGDMGAWAICWSWSAASVWTFRHFRCITGVNSEDEDDQGQVRAPFSP